MRRIPSVPRLVPLALGLLTAGGCAIPGNSSLSRTDPATSVVETRRLVEEAYPDVWDRLLSGLSSGPFEVEDANRDAGTLEVSFSAAEPERYVDCGTTTRTYRRGEDRQTYTYPLAAASTYRWAMGVGSHGHLPLTYEIDRDTELHARLIVRLVRRNGTTRVRATGRYTLTIAVTGDYVLESANGVPVDEGAVTPRTWELSFRTNEPNFTDLGTDEPVWVTCVSKGVLESRVLEMAEGGR